ncbi:MAG TPA: ABC transporter permease [Opitutaceae bacterium]|nr:ABC transporter permease [Opitutaceae bacterium]
MFQDLRYAFRRLLKAPGFTAVAVLTLALGIAGSTIFYGALRALVLDPLPYPTADRLVQLWSGPQWPLSVLDYFDIADSVTSFEELGAYAPQRVNLGGERPQSIPAAQCTSGVLRAFGISPLLGRLLEPADEEPGATPVAVISHALWRSAFNADPSVVGRTVPFNGGTVTIVGVMPRHFEFAAPWMRGNDCQLWKPLTLSRTWGNRGSHWMCAVGRLKPGVTRGAAEAEIKAVGVRLTAAYPDSNTGKPFLLRTLHEEMTEYEKTGAWMMFGAVLLVLLIACSNVASMLLARGALRQAELGLRTAVGASRSQLFRLVLCESLLIALAGTALGLLLADVGSGPLASFLPIGESRRAAAAPGFHAVMFAAGLAALSALLAGLPAAWAGTRSGIADLLRGGTRSASGSHVRHRLLRGLVVGQIVVAFMLVNGAALFTASYLKIRAANRDLASEQVLVVELAPRGPRYDSDQSRAAFCERLVETVAAIPGVSIAATTNKLPLEGGNNGNVLVDDQVYEVATERPLTEFSGVTPEYFATVGLRLLRGRTPHAEDYSDGHLGVVVNRAFAERFWPGLDPVGRTIRANDPTPAWTATVVGVVENVRQWGPTQDPQPEIYWSPARGGRDNVFLVVRTAQPALQLAEPLRRAVASIDPDLPFARVRTLEGLVDDATRSQRLLAWLVAVFMGLALLLVAIGLFGTLSYLVQQRTREIGIRLALGAAPAGIGRLVIGQGLRWVLLGAALGIAGAYGAAALLRSLLWGVAPFHPATLALGFVVITAVGLLACWLPTRRATRVDPLVALRAE